MTNKHVQTPKELVRLNFLRVLAKPLQNFLVLKYNDILLKSRFCDMKIQAHNTNDITETYTED